MAVGTGVHNLSLVVRAHNRARRALHSVADDLDHVDRARMVTQAGFSALAGAGLLALQGAAVAIGGFTAASVVAFSKFDAEMTRSLAIAGEVAPEMEAKLSQAARDVAKNTLHSANDAAGAYYHLLSAGLDVGQSLEALPVVATFAQAGMFDLEKATMLLTSAQSALGLNMADPIENMEEMTRLADLLASADQNAAGSIEEFAEALNNRAAAAMKTYGIAVEEGIAVLEVWAMQGLRGKSAGEAFSIVTRDLQKAALQEADAWREVNAAVYDSQGNLRAMPDIIGDLENAMKDLTDAEKKQLLTDLGFQERSQARLLQLIGTSDAMREFIALNEEAAGTVQETADNQMETAISQLKLLKNAIVDVFIGTGSEFNAGFVAGIQKLRDWVIEIGPKAQEMARKFIDAVKSVAEVAGDAFKAINADSLRDVKGIFRSLPGPVQTIVKGIRALKKWWEDLNPTIKEWLTQSAKLIPIVLLIAGAITALGAVLGVVFSPAILMAAAIAGLVMAFKMAYERSETFRNVVDAVVRWFKDVAVPWLKEAWENIKEMAAVAWEFLQAAFETGIAVISGAWDMFGADLMNIIKAVWDFIKQLVVSAWNILKAVFEAGAALLKGDWSGLWEAIKKIGINLWNAIWSFLKNAWEVLKSAWNILLTWMKTFWGAIWTGLKALAKAGWEAFKTWFSNAWETMKTVWSAGWTALKDKVGDIFAGLVGKVKGPINSVLSAFESLINNAIGGLNLLIKGVNKIPGVDIGTVGNISIPRLARGGTVMRSGMAMVGERGPETLFLPKGAQVAPLDHPRSQVSSEPTNWNITFIGTPAQMLSDFRRQTKIDLRV